MALGSLESLEISLPAQNEFAYESNGFLFVGKQCNFKGQDGVKYLVNVFSGEKNIGRFTFFVSDEDVPEIIFEGMLVKPEYRSKGIYNEFMMQLFRIAVSSGGKLDLAVPQRKPLMCRILHKYGFRPVVTNERRSLQEVVYVGRGEIASRIYVHFPSMAKRRNFEGSHIFRVQNYEIVTGVEQIRDFVECVLNVPYLRCE